MIFDKTGTLTVGKPGLTEIRTLGGQDRTELLRWAAAVERLSEHPLAQAVVTALTVSFPRPKDFRPCPDGA